MHSSGGYHDRRGPAPPPAAAPLTTPLPQPTPTSAPAALPPVSASYQPPSEKQMSTEEIEAMIEKLKREKEQREAATASSKPPADQERYAEHSNQIRDSTTLATSGAPTAGGAYMYEKYTPA